MLYGIEAKEIRMSFESPQTGVSKVCWMDNISGDFLVSSPKTGAVRLYNAAMPKSKEIIKVSKHGILNILETKNRH